MLVREIPAPLVDILWDDADATNEWENEVNEEEALVHTVGFLVKENKASYYISHTCYTDDEGTLHWNSKIRIPKGMVKFFKVLVKAS